MGRLALEAAVKAANGETASEKKIITPTAFYSFEDRVAIEQFLAEQ